MSNKSIGSQFEKEFCNKLAEHGYWAHGLQDNRNGQPFDVIAAREMKTHVIDCKDCTSSVFKLSRIEENQKLAMNAWQRAGNSYALFAVRFDEEIYIILYDSLMDLIKAGKKQITKDEAKELGSRFEDWIMGVRW
jgi:Holliday junction resolvase